MPAATVPITGDTGRIKFDDTSLVQFNQFSIEASAETKETVAYDDVQGWALSTEATMKRWNGSASGSFTQDQYTTLLNKLGVYVDGEFITQSSGVGTGEYGYGGQLVIENVSMEHQVGEIVTASITFKGTGPLAPIATA